MMARMYNDAMRRAATHPHELKDIYNGDLPIHMAARLATSKELIEVFVRQYPASVMVRSELDGKLPIEIIRDQGARLRIDYGVIDILEKTRDLHWKVYEEIDGGIQPKGNDVKKGKKMSVGRRASAGLGAGLRKLSMSFSIARSYDPDTSITKMLALSRSKSFVDQSSEHSHSGFSFKEKVARVSRRTSADLRRRLSMTYRRGSIDNESKEVGPKQSNKGRRKSSTYQEDRNFFSCDESVDPSINNGGKEKYSYTKASVLKEKFTAIQRKVARRSQRKEKAKRKSLISTVDGKTMGRGMLEVGFGMAV